MLGIALGDVEGVAAGDCVGAEESLIVERDVGAGVGDGVTGMLMRYVITSVSLVPSRRLFRRS